MCFATLMVRTGGSSATNTVVAVIASRRSPSAAVKRTTEQGIRPVTAPHNQPWHLLLFPWGSFPVTMPGYPWPLRSKRWNHGLGPQRSPDHGRGARTLLPSRQPNLDLSVYLDKLLLSA